MFVSGMCAPTFVPKVELEDIFPWGFDHVSSKSWRQFQTHYGGVGEMKLSLSETELFEKKKRNDSGQI